MVSFVREARQQIAHCSVEAFTDHYAAIGDEACKVVELGRRIIEVLNRDDVRISESNHVLNNQVSVLEFAADHAVKERSEAGHSHLGMLVDERREERPAHDLAEMDELLMAADSKLFHGLAALNDHLAGRIHAEGSQYVDDFLSVGSHAVENCG